MNPAEGLISSPAGLRTNPVTQKREFHDGIDIACPVGTPVYATRAGEVTAAGFSASYGHYLKLAFDGGYTALYAHLDSLAVSEREAVSQGQVVAYSGNTGRSTGPHLHYSLFLDGQYINPAPLTGLAVAAP